MSYKAEWRHTIKEHHARHMFQTMDGFRARREHALRKGKRVLYAAGAFLVCLLLFGAWPFAILALK